jgi:hypothetical protein
MNPKTPEIKIGRMPDCEIKIDDNLLSKYQCHIKFEGYGWVLHDGYGGKPSTNSNWYVHLSNYLLLRLYLNDDFEMYNGMVFKANHTLFEVKNVVYSKLNRLWWKNERKKYVIISNEIIVSSIYDEIIFLFLLILEWLNRFSFELFVF